MFERVLNKLLFSKIDFNYNQIRKATGFTFP